ncbi:MAG: hypothetical protein ACRC8S_10715 [Fimbriiglobus sp.]
MGRRLRAFEEAWEKTSDEDAKKAALKILPKVTNQFFSLQLGAAGKTLDEARWALTKYTPTPEERWAASWHMEPELVASDFVIFDNVVQIKRFYPIDPTPENATYRIGFAGQKPVEGNLTGKRLEIRVPYGMPDKKSAGLETKLVFEVLVAGKVLHRVEVGITLIRNISDRRDALTARLDVLKKQNIRTIETTTAKDRLEFLNNVLDRQWQETDFPISRMFAEAEEMVLDEKKPFFTADRPGQFWMSLNLPSGITPVRLFVPANLDAKKPVPIVVAMHGAGGTENLFFEGYGAGHIVKECEKRGWILVAPRAGFVKYPPVSEIVTALATRYPIDTKAIFLVGHSMGAGHISQFIQSQPTYPRAVAMLAGVAKIRDAKPLLDLPIYLATGEKDPLGTSSKPIYELLKAAGAKRTTFELYPDLEHLVIVREALPKVFTNWDAELKK